jgi:hypothetical protein
MAAALLISVHRMTAGQRTLTEAEIRAYCGTLRIWAEDEGEPQRLAKLVVWGRYAAASAVNELAYWLAWKANKAGLPGNIGLLALADAIMIGAISAAEEKNKAVLQRMIAAAEREFQANRRGDMQAARAAADIAEAEGVPPDLIDSAYRIARWRTRRGA